MEEAAAQTVWTREHWVYGLKLRPWCLLSSMRLEAINSPWAHFGIATPENTWIAAQICAAGFEPVQLKPLGIVRGFLHEFDRQVDAMRVYMRDYEAPPEYWSQQSNDTASPETPWQYRLLGWAMHTLHMDLQTAWTIPLGQLLWLRAAHEERQAMIHGQPSPIYGPSARAAADMLAKLKAQKQ